MDSKLGILSRISEIYKDGGNIIQFLKGMNKQAKNNLEDILISYDFQAGSYIDFVTKDPDYIEKYTSLLVREFEKLDFEYSTILEVGVGEATTLVNVLLQINDDSKQAYGFDISWSRIHYGNSYIRQREVKNANLFTGDLFNIPLKENSIDIVYTSHSLEPNGGKEKEALTELYRITNKYLVLLEPAYEFANDAIKQRMVSHGYVKNLVGIAKELGYNVIENRLFELCSNELNPTQIIIIEKNRNATTKSVDFYCPITKTKLSNEDDSYYTSEGLLAYPVIKEIPCLMSQNAIVAAHFNSI